MATNDVVAQTEDILNIKDIEDAKATISKYARKNTSYSINVLKPSGCRC